MSASLILPQDRGFCFFLSTWSAQVDASSKISEKFWAMFLWGAEEVVPSQRKEWRGRGDRKDLQNSHCWSKPDFQHKTKGQWKLWELSFFFLAFSLFPSPLFFLYFLPSPLSLQSDKVFVLHFKQKRAQNLGGQSKKKKKKTAILKCYKNGPSLF